MQRLLSKRFFNGSSSSLLFHSQPTNKPFTTHHHFLSSSGKYPIQCFRTSSRPILTGTIFTSLVGGRAGILEARVAKGYRGFDRGFGLSGPDWGSWFKRLTANDVVWGLVIANAGVFLLWRIASPRLMVENFMISLDNFRSGRIHTLVTSAFSHKDFGHLFSNMLGLYFFGVNIAHSFGPHYLLKLYLWGATGGSVLYLLHHYFMALSSKGASGAVNAIMLLEIFLNPRATIMFDFIIPVPAMLLPVVYNSVHWFQGVFVIGKDVWRIVQGDSNISGSAHLGGAAVAAVAWYRIRRGRF
ncbi:RHOMBOID-like protein 12, mitochondrial [Linum perenne]